LEQRKNKRGNKVFIDFLRNDYAMTAIAPYSLRAKKGAPIATPLEWEELNDSSLHPQSYHLKNIFQRLGKKDNPWKNFNKYNRHIELDDLLD
jgi:bifunctional non-homologous end joining protein LigD